MKIFDKKPLSAILGLLGLLVVLFYLTSTTGFLKLPKHATIIFVFALGPLAIVGVLSIAQRLATTADGLILKAATVFGIIAFALWETVMAIQQGIRIFFRERVLPEAVDSATQETIKLIQRGVNSVQWTMDVAFDVFYCLLIILFGFLMYRHRDFGRFLGVLGIVSAAGLLILNMWTFPFPPAESGLFDLGPLTGIWWVLVIIQMFRVEHFNKSTMPGA